VSPDPLAAECLVDELVTVVVCTLGREPRVRQTVEAVLDQTHAHLELLVVDNDPPSRRVTGHLAGIDDPRLRVLAEPDRGLSVARNTGLYEARGTLLAYTDDDAVPDPDWLERLVEVVRDDPTGLVTCVTGRVVALRSDTAEQRWFEEFGDFDKGLERTVWSCAAAPQQVRGTPGRRSAFFPYTAGEMGSGNNMLFRTGALRELGAFDEALGAGTPARGGEDLDIYRRVLLAGQVLVYTPKAVVRHDHRDTAAALRTQMFGYGAGMAASLTKVLVAGGPPARALLRQIPKGVRMLLSPSSDHNRQFPDATPRALVRRELAGYLAGPILYGVSRSRSRRRRAPRGQAAGSHPGAQPVR
jgi:cellulose synthase/poly-beta-1,6-N-acetylglucosamine synthase-like glycosyltransferase